MSGRYGLRKVTSGQYATPSGRFLVESDESYENECECIHCLDSRVWDCRSAVQGQRRDFGWHVWDEQRGDYAVGSGYQEFDTMKAAAAFALASEEGA